MTRTVQSEYLRLAITAWGFLVLIGGLAGCGVLTGDRVHSVSAQRDVDEVPSSTTRPTITPPTPEKTPGIDGRRRSEFIEYGTGMFVGSPRPGGEGPLTENTVTLNFQGTPLTDVVKVILGDLLGANYVVDPSVRGRVTLQTSHPIARENLVPTLEMLLRMNGAAVVLSGDIYHVMPRERAGRGVLIPQLGDTDTPLPQGYAMQVVPLRFVSAREMAQILAPFAPPGSILRVDTARNLLLLAGSTDELAGLTESVQIFDVDWLKGLSFGLFSPDFVDATTLAGDLRHIFGVGPLAGLVRIIPIERLGALLVVSPRREYLAQAAEWIKRFDRSSGTVDQRLFVYAVENGKAADLALLLNQILEPQKAAAGVKPAQLAPGLVPVDIRSGAVAGANEGETPVASRPDKNEPSAVPGEGLFIGGSSQIRIIASEANNALLVMATAQQYRQILRALNELDVAPLQVLIEATIAEVTLTGELSLGLEWFFKNRLGNRPGEAGLDLGAAGLAPAIGFSYVLRSAADVRLVLNALASESKLNIVSSPSLMVLNNHLASIQVGDQVPVTTRQQQATAAGSTLVNNVEFRDTGVLLKVTPRANSGGLVVLELEQEVSDVAPGSAGSLTPTIQQRKINSTVAVQSGETVVLGGLIRENENQSRTGVPGLSRLPLLGWLFGTNTDSTRRTELVVLITPRAVQGTAAARRITEEFRSKMESLKPFYVQPKADRPAPALSAPSEGTRPREDISAKPIVK